MDTFAAPAAPVTRASTSERNLVIVGWAASRQPSAAMYEFVVALLRAAAASDWEKVEAYLLKRVEAEVVMEVGAVFVLLRMVGLEPCPVGIKGGARCLGEKADAEPSSIAGAVAADRSLTSSGKSRDWLISRVFQKRCRKPFAALLLATLASMDLALVMTAACGPFPLYGSRNLPSLSASSVPGTAGELGIDE